MNITKYKLTIGATVLGSVLAFAGFGQTADEARVLPLTPLEREIRGAKFIRIGSVSKRASFCA